MTDYFANFPPSLRIGPFDIAVLIRDKIGEEDHSGLYTHGITIELRADQHNAAFALDTVLHEIGHGIYRTFGLERKSSEEAVVSAMATGWVMVFRDNPELLSWLYRMIPSSSRP
jgi:hypothetical protein